MYKPAQGLDYREFLEALHKTLQFEWYLEIGSQTGLSLAKSRSPSVAVDPEFRLKHNVMANKSALHMFQLTSDDFFAAGHLKALKVKPSFSFLDGMHLFEFLLRDFFNTEAAGSKTSVIALHDCCPFGGGLTTRDVDNRPRGPWTGDVWKLIPILQEYRPDLNIEVVGCAPTGLVVVSNLDPQNRVLQDKYDEILGRYLEVDLDTFGVKRFFDSFTYTNPTQIAVAGFPGFQSASCNVRPA
jgi:hypothetical protein